MTEAANEPTMDLKCSLCNNMVKVPMSVAQEMFNSGTMASFSHEPGQCPTDPKEGQKRFQVLFLVREVLEENETGDVTKFETLASAGSRKNGPSLQSVLNELVTDVSSQVVQIQQRVAIIDQG